MNDIFVTNSQRHSRDTKYCNFNVVCPKYNRETVQEEKRSELPAVNSGICYLCPLGKKNRLRP